MGATQTIEARAGGAEFVLVRRYAGNGEAKMLNPILRERQTSSGSELIIEEDN